jgi:hypothetical protein
MSIRRMMLFTLGAKIKNLVQAFKERVLNTQGQFEAEGCLEAQLTQLDNQSLLDNASLIVTPNGYKENLLYSVVPNNTIGDMSVTRATTATRVNADGFIEQVPYNLLQRSEEFENTIWAKVSGSSVIQNTTTAPNGTLTADTINLATQSESRVVQGALSLDNLTSYTASCYFKNISLLSGETFNFRLSNITASPNNFVIIGTVDLFNGTVVYSQQGTNITGITGIGSASIQSVGNDWYRVIITGTTGTSAATNVGSFQIINSTARSFYAWGAQLVTGAQPKDYFPTTNRQNVPRIDYSNGSCPSILVEPQRTNLVLRSEEFENASWIKTNTTITANSIISPSGIQNADKIVEVNGGNTPRVISTPTLVIGTAYTLSFYLKSAERNQVRAVFEGSAARSAYFNSTTGVVSVIGGSATASMSLLNNGWYRCLITITPTQTNGGFYIATAENNQIISSGDNTKGIFIWGTQLEAGTNATSYIPTVASTVTRNADVITNTNASTLIGQTEGSMYVEFNNTPYVTVGGGVRWLLCVRDPSTNNFLKIYRNTAINIVNRVGMEFHNGTFVLNLFSPSNIYDMPLGRNKVLVTYQNGIYKLFQNGALRSTVSNSLTVPTNMSRIDVGSFVENLSANLSDGIYTAILYKTVLTDTQAINLTTL